MALSDHRLRLVAMGIDADIIAEVDPADLPVATESDAPPDRTGVRSLPTTAEDRAAGRTRHEVVVEGWVIVVTAESAARAALRERATRMSGASGRTGPHTLRARIPGRIAQVWVVPGAAVQAGDRLLSIEAMKMENEIRAPHAGTVRSISVAVGDRVELGADLVVVA